MKDSDKLAETKQLRRSRVMLWACGIYGLLLIISIIAFKGGNLISPMAAHFNLLNNYLSDLGTTQTIIGNNNLFAATLFIIGTVILGLGMLDFATNWRNFAANNKKTELIGPASGVLLAAAGVTLVCIAISPWNLYFREHVLITKLFAGFIFGWSVCYTYLLAVTKQTKLLVMVSAINTILLCLYIFWIVFGPIYGTETSLVLQTSFEKLIVLVTIANLAYQAYAIKQRITSTK